MLPDVWCGTFVAIVEVSRTDVLVYAIVLEYPGVLVNRGTHVVPRRARSHTVFEKVP